MKNATSFQKGHTPFNKGKKWEEYLSDETQEKIRKTTFKKGNVPHNTKDDGAERLSKEGYVEVRVLGKYMLKHRKIWQDHHGEIPKNHIIIFKDNNKQNFDIDNLECISRAENAIRNKNLPNFPRELQQLDYTRALLKRKTKQNGKK